MTAILLPTFLALGAWQLDRARDKEALTATREARADLEPLHRADTALEDLLYRKLRLSGHYLDDRQFLLDAMVHRGVPGFHVLTPFVVTGGGPVVLVNRGWIPMGATRSDRPGIEVPRDETMVEGTVAALPRPGLRIGSQNNNEEWPAVVLFPTAEQINEKLGQQIYPYQLMLDAKEPNGFVRQWQMDDTKAARHRGYALQWFSFAAILVGLFIALNLRTENTNG